MKKFILAALAVCSLSLVSCGGKKDEATKETTKQAEKETVLNNTGTATTTTGVAFDFEALGIDADDIDMDALMEQIKTGDLNIEALGIDAENVNMDALMEQLQKANEFVQSNGVDLDAAAEVANQAGESLQNLNTGDIDLDEATELAKKGAAMLGVEDPDDAEDGDLDEDE